MHLLGDSVARETFRTNEMVSTDGLLVNDDFPCFTFGSGGVGGNGMLFTNLHTSEQRGGQS